MRIRAGSKVGLFVVAVFLFVQFVGLFDTETEKIASTTVEGTEPRYTWSTINVREGRGTNTAVVRTLAAFQQVAVLDSQDGWWLTYVDGVQAGYVSNSVLHLRPRPPSQRTTSSQPRTAVHRPTGATRASLWTNLCPDDSVSYCRDVGKSAYNATGTQVMRNVKLGKIIGVTWRPKDSLIGRGRVSPRYAYYYIIDDGAGPAKAFIRQAREIRAVRDK